MTIDAKTFLERLLVNAGDQVSVKFWIDPDIEDGTDLDPKHPGYGAEYIVCRTGGPNVIPGFPLGIKSDDAFSFSRWYVSPGDIEIDRICGGGILVPKGLTILCRSVEEEEEDEEEEPNWD